MSPLRHLTVLVRKDVRLEWRAKSRLASVLLFGVVTLSLFSFAAGPDSPIVARAAAGFLVLALLLSSILGLGESFRVENENSALEGLRLLPTDPAVLFVGKALGNLVFLLLLAPLLAPVAILLYAVEVGPIGVLRLLWVWLLTSAALSAPGTLYAAMTSRLSAKDVLLPILYFPVVIPVLLAAVRAMDLALYGDPMQQLGSWSVFLGGAATIFWIVGALVFSFAIED